MRRGYLKGMGLPDGPNIDAALRFIRERVAQDGYLDPDDAEQLIMVQDDPEEYMRRAAELLHELGDPQPPPRPTGPTLHYTPVKHGTGDEGIAKLLAAEADEIREPTPDWSGLFDLKDEARAAESVDVEAVMVRAKRLVPEDRQDVIDHFRADIEEIARR